MDFDEDSDDYDNLDNEQVEMEEKTKEECRYEILNKTELLEFMNQTIERLNNVIPISSNSLEILLNYFKWDEDKLTCTYFDGDQEKLFQDANITNPFKEDILIPNYQENCDICYEHILVSEISGLGCEHKYCNDCWSEYLSNRILDEGMGRNVTCAGHLCPILIDHKTCLNLLKNPRAVEVYKTIITNSFVATNPSLRWCSGLDCTYAIKCIYLLEQDRPVMCQCGAITCFHCGRNWHNPMQCNMYTTWLKKCEQDSETSKWLGENTKDCPNCKVPIEKLGGCNHIACNNKDCCYEFCWICMGNWEMHQCSFKCYYFNKEETKAVRMDQHSSRIDLERFIFHYDRYMNHKKSLELEHKLYEIVIDQKTFLKKFGISAIADIKFYTQCIDSLRYCRTTLMYTYPFAYYLKKNNQSEIFSYNQNDLQNSVEILSEYLERNIQIDNYSVIIKKIGNLQIYCDKRCKVLETHILDGYKERFWEFRDDYYMN